MNPLTNPITNDAVRDAIHVAIAPVIAKETLSPGDHVGVINGIASKASSHIGIVNPFLKGSLRSGDHFYVCLYPDTVTGMTHHWEHPSFQEVVPSLETQAAPEKDKALAEAWLKKFSQRVGVDFHDLICGLRERSSIRVDEDSTDEYYNCKGELWRNYEVFSGEKTTEDDHDNVYFRCAC